MVSSNRYSLNTSSRITGSTGQWKLYFFKTAFIKNHFWHTIFHSNQGDFLSISLICSLISYKPFSASKLWPLQCFTIDKINRICVNKCNQHCWYYSKSTRWLACGRAVGIDHTGTLLHSDCPSHIAARVILQGNAPRWSLTLPDHTPVEGVLAFIFYHNRESRINGHQYKAEAQNCLRDPAGDLTNAITWADHPWMRRWLEIT